MKQTGMSRKIDELGRVVIPIEIRKELGINNKDTLEIGIENNNIILSKKRTSCVLCSNEDNLIEVKNNRHMCIDCLGELSS